MQTTAPTPRRGSGLCENCHIRPRHNDGKKVHPYCSKTCATKKLNAKPSQGGSTRSLSGFSRPSAQAMCDFCHQRPKYKDATKTHDFCGKTCARNASRLTGSRSVCLVPACNFPAPASSSGRQDYCSIAHKTLAETHCLQCLVAPKVGNSHFCSFTCRDLAQASGPGLLLVPSRHNTFKDVAEQFKSSWRHPTTCPPVWGVYKICYTKASLAAYDAYKASVEAVGNFVRKGLHEGNERRRWHGTSRVCTIGDNGNTVLCSSTRCSLCGIIRSSFKISHWGKKTSFGRFGEGIYTSSTSSKSNDYTDNGSTSNSELLGMLLNKVVVGRGHKMFADDQTLKAPPAGHDSVLAEVGGVLNYDELVVYNDDAVRPSFLVMYKP